MAEIGLLHRDQGAFDFLECAQGSDHAREETDHAQEYSI